MGFRALGFRKHDFSSEKRFLDVGAGHAGTTLNWGPRVYGADPILGKRAYSPHPTPMARKRSVRAKAESLPFRDQQFHHVYSTNSVGYYNRFIPFGQSTLEMLRVVAREGDVRLLVRKGDPEIERILKKATPLFERAGISVSLESSRNIRNRNLLRLVKTNRADLSRLRTLFGRNGLLRSVSI